MKGRRDQAQARLSARRAAFDERIASIQAHHDVVQHEYLAANARARARKGIPQLRSSAITS